MKNKMRTFSLIILSASFLLSGVVAINNVDWKQSLIFFLIGILNLKSIHRKKPSGLSLIFYGMLFIYILSIAMTLISSALGDSLVTYNCLVMSILLVLFSSTTYLFYIEIKWLVRYKKKKH